VEEIQRDHADFECLINNLGDGKAEKIDDIDFDSADRAMKINLLAPLVLTTGLMKNIKKNEADIINIGATI
jgi:short-subunit dehydrogenase